MDDARARVEEQLRKPKPVSWTGAALIALVWVTLAAAAAWVWFRRP